MFATSTSYSIIITRDVIFIIFLKGGVRKKAKKGA